MLIYAWVGMHHPPRTGLKLVPLMAVGYALPLILSHSQPPLDLRALISTLAVGVVVADTIAGSVQRSTASLDRAARAARLFAAAGRTTSRLSGLEPDGVLDEVVDGVMDLGYDGANLAVLEVEDQCFRPIHCRGLSHAFEGLRFPLTAGLTGQVVATGAPATVADYATADHALPLVTATGTRTAIGVPVLVDGSLVAVLMANYSRVVTVHPEDVEVLRIMAVHAGGALASRGQLVAERGRADANARASLTDDLTGIGNRRQATTLLRGLAAGDTVALIDVDHFKAVNDTLGHDAGDHLLRTLARHLAAHVRRVDQVVRYGGEEFLVVLPATPLAGATRLLDRLRHEWAATHPLATFSAGTAERVPGEETAATMRRADEALYRAKEAGRNRVCTDDLDAAARRTAGT